MVRDISLSDCLVATVGPVTAEGFDVSVAHNVLFQVTLLKESLVATRPLTSELFRLFVNGFLVIGQCTFETESPVTTWKIALERLFASVDQCVRHQSGFLTTKRSYKV